MRALVLAASLVLAGAAPALAQITTYDGGHADYRPNSSLGDDGRVASSREGVDAQFKKLDLNHDGMISRFEWNVAGLFVPDFANLDANKDGKISPEEWGGGLTGRAEAKSDKAKTAKK